MIKLAVIGIGRMGLKHAVNLAKGRAKGGILVAVCDIDTAKLSSFSARFKDISLYNDYKEMLIKQELDAVIIATPHYSHTEIAIDCLRANKHILVEKPIAVQVSEALKLNNEAKEHKGLIFSLMYNQRTNRMYREAKNLILSGALGEIRRINYIVTDWYRSQAYFDQGEWRASWGGEGGGALINQCVHQLDILQWLVGMPESVYALCNTRFRKITVENEVVALMKYSSGAILNFTAATNELKGTNRLEIVGDKGKIIIDLIKMKYHRFNKSETEVNLRTVRGYGYTGSVVKRKWYGLVNIIHDLTIGQQFNIIKNFILAIEGKQELIAPGEEGINALALINAIYLSGYTGKEVSIPLNCDEYDKWLISMIDREKRLKEGKR